MPSAPDDFLTALANIGVLVVFGVPFAVWYFRLCRKCWREFKFGVADAGGWSKRPAESSNPRICPMCGAVIAKPIRQCPACGEKLPIDLLFTWVPKGVLLTGIVLAIVVPTLIVAAVSVVLCIVET